MVRYVNLSFEIKVSGGDKDGFSIRVETVFKAMKLGEMTKEFV